MHDFMKTVPAGGQFPRDPSSPKHSGRWLALATLSAVAITLAAVVWRERARRPAHQLQVVRCPIHGIAYDAELEVCPECAKPVTADDLDLEGGGHLT